MKLTKCANCGSPLVGGKCKRCGAEHDGSGVQASFMEDDVFGTLKVGGVEYDVYLAEVTCDRAFCDHVLPGVGLFRDPLDFKHKFVLIEC